MFLPHSLLQLQTLQERGCFPPYHCYLIFLGRENLIFPYVYSVQSSPPVPALLSPLGVVYCLSGQGPAAVSPKETPLGAAQKSRCMQTQTRGCQPSSLWQRKPAPGKCKIHVDPCQCVGVRRSCAAAVPRLGTFPDLWRLCLKTAGEGEAQTEPCDSDSCHVSSIFFLLFCFFVGFTE